MSKSLADVEFGNETSDNIILGIQQGSFRKPKNIEGVDLQVRQSLRTIQGIYFLNEYLIQTQGVYWLPETAEC